MKKLLLWLLLGLFSISYAQQKPTPKRNTPKKKTPTETNTSSSEQGSPKSIQAKVVKPIVPLLEPEEDTTITYMDFSVSKGLGGAVSDMLISNNGVIGAFVGVDKQIILYNMLSRQVIGTVSGSAETGFTCMAFSPNDKYFVAIGDGNFVRIYDIEKHQSIFGGYLNDYVMIDLKKIESNEDAMMDKQISKEEKFLYSRNSTGVSITDNGIITYCTPLSVHKLSLYSELKAIDPDIASGPFERKGTPYMKSGQQSLQPWRKIQEDSTTIDEVRYSPNLKFAFIKKITSSPQKKWFEVWDVENRKLIRKIDTEKTSIQGKDFIQLSNDGKRMYVKKQTLDDSRCTFYEIDLVGLQTKNLGFTDNISDPKVAIDPNSSNLYVGNQKIAIPEENEISMEAVIPVLQTQVNFNVRERLNTKAVDTIFKFSQGRKTPIYFKGYTQEIQFNAQTKSLYVLDDENNIHRLNLSDGTRSVSQVPQSKPIHKIYWPSSDSLIVVSENSVRIFNLFKVKQTLFYSFSSTKLLDFDVKTGLLLTSNGEDVLLHDVYKNQIRVYYKGKNIHDVYWLNASQRRFMVNTRETTAKMIGSCFIVTGDKVDTLHYSNFGKIVLDATKIGKNESDVYAFEERKDGIMRDKVLIDAMAVNTNRNTFLSNIRISMDESMKALGESSLLNDTSNASEQEMIKLVGDIFNKAIPGEVRVWNYTSDTIQSYRLRFHDFSRKGIVALNSTHAYNYDPSNKYIEVWNLQHRNRVGKINATDRDWSSVGEKDFELTYFNMSQSNQFLISAGNDNSIEVRKLLWGKEDVSDSLLARIYLKAPVASITFLPDESFAVVGLKDGSIELISTQNAGNYILSLHIGQAENDYVMRMPNNFTAGKDGLHRVSYVHLGRQISYSQLDPFYNRPDLVSLRLAQIFSKTDQEFQQQISDNNIELLFLAKSKNVKRYGLTLKDTITFGKISYLNISTRPTLNILNKQALLQHQVTLQSQVSIVLEMSNTTSNISRLLVWVNGTPIYGTQGLNLTQTKSKLVRKELVLALSEGENRIELVCVSDKGVESITEEVHLYYQPSRPHKPTLYFVGIGTDRYREKVASNLSFACKDIRDILNIYKKSNHLFEQIVVDTLFNEQVTSSSIKKIKEKLMKSRVDDLVIIYVSGHGSIVSSDFYLITSTTNYDSFKTTSLHFDQLEALTDGIPARNKMMLIDACHSGENDIEENNLDNQTAFAVMQELFVNLRRHSGINVIAAAFGNAYEDSDIKNGVFTHVFKNALSSEADYNKDGKVFFSELARYMQQEVPKINKQQPSVRQYNYLDDFRVW